MLLLMMLALTACYGGGGGPPAEDRIQFERNTEFDGESLRVFLTLEDGT